MEEWEHLLEIASYPVDQKKMSKGPVDHTKKMSRVVIGCRVAVPRSNWLAACLLHLPVVEGLIF